MTLRERAIRRGAGRGLTAFTRSLLERNGRTEQDFVQLGETLRVLYSHATGLAQLVRNRAAGLRTAVEQSRLTGAEGLAARLLREVHVTLDQVSHLVHSLSDTGLALDRLQSRVRDIERMGVYLNSSVVGFSVESARSPECQQSFGAFVEELRNLAALVTRLGTDITQETKATRQFHFRTLAGISSGLDRLRRLGQDLETAARDTSGQAQSLLNSSLAALQRAENCASNILRCAEEAVFHLQFGDIIRQKNEHILSALQEAAAALSGARPGGGLSGGLAEMDSWLAIQASQLEAVRAEALAAQSKLATSFENIAAETEQLACVLHPPTEDGSLTDPLEAFARDCHRMQSLQQQGRALGRQAAAAADKASAAASQLSGHFRQLGAVNFELHLKALNAIVKTTSLGGHGATLEVLSSQIDRLFRESNREVPEIFALLERLRPATSGPSPAPESAPATPQWIGDEQRLPELIGKIRQAHQAFASASAEADELVRQQQASLAESRAQLGFLSDLADDLNTKITGLGEIRQLFAPWKGSLEARSSTTLSSLGERYTMQSEREVHARVSGEPSVPVTIVSGDSQGNVQLFDAPLRPPLPETELTVVTAEPPANPTANARSAAQPVLVAGAGQGFGDNVELF